MTGNSLKQKIISDFYDEEELLPERLNYVSTLEYRSFVRYYENQFAGFLPNHVAGFLFCSRWLQTLGLARTFRKCVDYVRTQEGTEDYFISKVEELLRNCYISIMVPTNKTYLALNGAEYSKREVKRFFKCIIQDPNVSYTQTVALIDLVKAINNQLDKYAYKFLIKYEHDSKKKV